MWQTQPPTNDGPSIAALVCGVASILCLPITGPVGVGLGILGIRRTRRNGTQGFGLAVAGIATGAVGTLLLAIVLVVALTSPEAFA